MIVIITDKDMRRGTRDKCITQVSLVDCTYYETGSFASLLIFERNGYGKVLKDVDCKYPVGFIYKKP